MLTIIFVKIAGGQMLRQCLVNNGNATTNHDYTGTVELVPGDALPPEACHVGGKVEDLLGGQV